MENIDNRLIEINRLRTIMNTMPEDQPPREDKILYGATAIKVELLSYPKNPYKAFYEMVTSTWSSRKNWWTRWEDATPEGRKMVVLAVLQRKTLPAALEVAKFVFKCQGVTRASFDQFARHRHAAIASVGSRDNSHVDAAIIVPHALRKKYGKKIKDWWKHTKDLYTDMVEDGHENWQNARIVLPMSMDWRWTWSMDYRGVQDMCLQRLVFCEQGDTVAMAWAMREAIVKKFPLLGAFLRPRCDFSNKCTYVANYELSELFGALFKPCGRHPLPKDYIYATFNEACSDIEEIEKDLKIKIPRPGDWDEIVEKALEADARYFE